MGKQRVSPSTLVALNLYTVRRWEIKLEKMGGTEQKEPLVEAWLRSLKNRPVVAVVIILVIIVTGIASFTESVDKLLTYFELNSGKDETTSRNQEDVLLEQLLVGTWEVSSMPTVPSGFVVTNLNFTFLPIGIINWGGSYKFNNYESPIMISGKWRVQDGVLHYVVESSNVPLMMKEGFSSTSKIIDVTNETMIYIDSIDRKEKVATRLE